MRWREPSPYSTCNRLKLYGELSGTTGERGRAQQELAERIAERAGLDERFVLDHGRVPGAEVPRHLFTVVSGLSPPWWRARDHGQVRRALRPGPPVSTASGHLVQLFEAAARTAREVGRPTRGSANADAPCRWALGPRRRHRPATGRTPRPLFGTGVHRVPPWPPCGTAGARTVRSTPAPDAPAVHGPARRLPVTDAGLPAGPAPGGRRSWVLRRLRSHARGRLPGRAAHRGEPRGWPETSTPPWRTCRAWS
ncbi:hypothetical protein QJS66_22285 [Kocuria rhizophila]|nr:hypothetical protein QJS66_22285 [Kocuria rhizophila]